MTAAASPSVMMIETNEREDNFDHLLDSQQYSKDEVTDDQTFAHLDGVQIKTNDEQDLIMHHTTEEGEDYSSGDEEDSSPIATRRKAIGSRTEDFMADHHVQRIIREGSSKAP